MESGVAVRTVRVGQYGKFGIIKGLKSATLGMMGGSHRVDCGFDQNTQARVVFFLMFPVQSSVLRMIR
jgi:hypothetical protein